MDPKSPFLSKTLWTNAALAVAAFFPTVQAYNTAHPMMLMEVFAVVNFLLRLVTKQAIGLSDS